MKQAPAVVVRIPGLLRSYTAGVDTVRLAGLPPRATLDDALQELDRRYPGLRFRIIDEQAAVRPHIKLFVDGALTRDLGAALPPAQKPASTATAAVATACHSSMARKDRDLSGEVTRLRTPAPGPRREDPGEANWWIIAARPLGSQRKCCAATTTRRRSGGQTGRDADAR